MSFRAFARTAAGGLAILLGASCSPPDPLEETVDASDGLALAMSESKLSARLSREQMAQFRDALQEIKFEVMAERSRPPSVSVDAAAMEVIDGLTVRAIFEKGFYWKQARLEAEIAERTYAMRMNDQVRTRPDDSASQEYLRTLRAHQAAVVAGDEAELLRLKQVLVSAGIPESPPIGSGAPPGSASDPAGEDEKPVRIR